MIIHTTIGVYNNDSHKMNGVENQYLKDHLKYNVEKRPGRALFLDGKCLHQGYLSKARCDEWEAKIKANPKEFTAIIDTQPYH